MLGPWLRRASQLVAIRRYSANVAVLTIRGHAAVFIERAPIRRPRVVRCIELFK